MKPKRIGLRTVYTEHPNGYTNIGKFLIYQNLELSTELKHPTFFARNATRNGGIKYVFQAYPEAKKYHQKQRYVFHSAQGIRKQQVKQ